MKSATTLVGEALEQGECLTSLEALQRFGVYHLAGTIRRLKAKGLQIESETIELANGKLIARYHMPSRQGVGGGLGTSLAPMASGSVRAA